MSESDPDLTKISLNEKEQELYDVLLDEYNDIFENILNLSETEIFDKILINSKAILGHKKIEAFSEDIISRIITSIKSSYYNNDIISLKPLKKYLNSNLLTKKIKLEIDDIFAHCRDCSQCYHICGQILLKFNFKNSSEYIICLKCKMVYKKNLIHLYCKECKEEYYSYIVDDNEPDYENYYPATWEKYHCPNFIYEEMTCPKCDNMLYYNERIQLLKCFECNWKCNANNKKWICELCNEEFFSPVKEYVRFETKPKVNCVRDALVKKILAVPPVVQCCEGGWEGRIDNGFKHVTNDGNKKCDGIYYLGRLQRKKVVVCSECRLVQQFKDVYWECPNCSKIFRLKKRKENKKIKNKGNNFSQNKTLLKDDKNTIFQPKKLHGFYKSEKRKENKEIFYSQDKNIINNNLKVLRNNKKKNKNINLAKIKINRSNNNCEDTNDENNTQSENDEENDNHNTESNQKFSFYKKSKKFLYSNLIKLKKIEKSDSISFNKEKEYSSKFLKNIKKNEKDSSDNQSKNTSLKDLKILSLKIPKYISIGKFNNKFNNKSFNENIPSSNQNLPNSESKNKNHKYRIKTKLIYSNKKNNLNIKINNFKERSHSKEKNKNEMDNSILIPDENFRIDEFKFIKQIGEGTFGKIYCVIWNKNNKEYAMKKMMLKTKAEIKRNKEQNDIICNYIKKTESNGVIKIFGTQCNEIENNLDDLDNKYEYNFYVLMELADIDWEKEINKRKITKNYYTESEIHNIMRQLIKSFSSLQKNNITHRDIKPQNILIVDNIYKIGDFGEAKITDNYIIKQSIKGTELYMSPILFRALSKRQNIIIHNTFKSDVFSLGMCLFYAVTLTFKSLYDIREINDSKLIKKILEKYLIVKYSHNFVNILVKMLEVDENLRPDFIELENDFFL